MAERNNFIKYVNFKSFIKSHVNAGKYYPLVKNHLILYRRHCYDEKVGLSI